MKMDAITLGIDVGTSTAKAVLADIEGKFLVRQSASYTYSKPHPGWAEQDPEDWWRAVCQVITALLRRYPSAERRIAGIGVSGQGVASVLLDRQGNSLRPAILWLDCRSASEADDLQARFGERIVAISGKRPAPYNVEPKLLWVKQNEPAIWSRIGKTLTTAAYITYRLTGHAVMNHSDGGILLAYDLARRAWSQETIRLMGIPSSFYCDLALCHQVVGTITAEASKATGVKLGTPVVAGGEDTSSAGLAMGVVSPETGLLSLGTASTMYVPLPNPIADPRVLAFPHVVEGLTLAGGSMVAGGLAMDWIADVVRGEKRRHSPHWINRLTEEACKVEPGSEGLVFLPYLAGELQPVNDGFARGVFFGLDLSKKRGHLVRAVMEGTAFAIQHNLSIAKELGAKVESLVAVGGPTRNKIWCQIIADVTGTPIQVMQECGGAPLGDCILAAIGSGLIESPEMMQQVHAKLGERFVPNASKHKRYMELFGIYSDLYPRLRDLFPRLVRFNRIHRKV